MTKNKLFLFPELSKNEHASNHGKGVLSRYGVLPSREIKELIRRRCIYSELQITEEQIQPAPIDLRFGSTAYQVKASFVPGRSPVMHKMQKLIIEKIDLGELAIFERGGIYIVPLVESLNLPRGISAKANPRSTTGRLDIFTRLITDYGTEFEHVPAGYNGQLYAEVVPRTFSIAVRQSVKLNQLRFIRGNRQPSDRIITRLNRNVPLVYLGRNQLSKPLIKEGLRVSVNLQGYGSSTVVGYKAKRDTPVIDFQKIDYYDPRDFWEPVLGSKAKGIILNPGDFYILGSKEKIRVPPTVAAEMVPFDPSLGEFRIHYAGFFDPGFGYGLSGIKGTPAVLEVRAHEVPFLIEDGQMVGRLIYTPLTSHPDKVYGTKIGSSYQRQALTLRKHFKKWR